MEHRWCKRWQLVLDVKLKCQDAGEYTAAVRTRNVSMDGMFVEIAPDSLTAAKVVHVQLPAVVGVRRLKALVAHRCEAGAGLMFCDLDNEGRHLLATYLSEGPAIRLSSC